MFSILNEIGNKSSFRTTGVVVASIGIAAFLYILVAITGYLSFGNAVEGNIVSMCKPVRPTCINNKVANDIDRSIFRQRDSCKSGHCYPCYVLLPSPSPSLQSFSRCCPEMAAKRTGRVAREIATKEHSIITTSKTSRPSATGRNGRHAVCRHHHCNHRPELHCCHDGIFLGEGARLCGQYRQHQYQLHSSWTVLLQDLFT